MGFWFYKNSTWYIKCNFDRNGYCTVAYSVYDSTNSTLQSSARTTNGTLTPKITPRPDTSPSFRSTSERSYLHAWITLSCTSWISSIKPLKGCVKQSQKLPKLRTYMYKIFAIKKYLCFKKVEFENYFNSDNVKYLYLPAQERYSNLNVIIVFHYVLP